MTRMNESDRVRGITRIEVMIRDKATCVYCRKPVAYDGNGSRPTIDHITPRKAGGNGRLDNLALACNDCNMAKGSRPLETEWLDMVMAAIEADPLSPDELEAAREIVELHPKAPGYAASRLEAVRCFISLTTGIYNCR